MLIFRLSHSTPALSDLFIPQTHERPYSSSHTGANTSRHCPTTALAEEHAAAAAAAETEADEEAAEAKAANSVAKEESVEAAALQATAEADAKIAESTAESVAKSVEEANAAINQMQRQVEEHPDVSRANKRSRGGSCATTADKQSGVSGQARIPRT